MTGRSKASRFFNPRADAAGLEIGTSSLKVVSLKAGKPPRLLALGSRPMPPGLIQDDQVTDPQGLAAEIKRLFAEVGVRKRPVVTAVANRSAITRHISLPKMSLRELGEAVKWEAERYIPFPLDEVILDYYVLDNPKDVPEGGQLEVLIAAARTDLVMQQLDCLKLAGLEPVVVDIKPFALLRALRGALLGAHLSKSTLVGQRYTEEGEVGVVLEVAASDTTITLVRGERVLMNRTIGVSGDDFTAAVQRALGLSFDEAEEVKLNYGVVALPAEDEEALNFDAKHEQFSPSRVYEALRPVLVDLTTEIRRSLEFYQSQAGNADISRVLVTGGAAKLRGLPEAIGNTLGFKVELGDPWLSTLVDESRFDSQFLRRVGPEFGVPLGLALRGVGASG
ncbi:type IV pilus assembly protein PilM [soil metagenome]|jgi:type IV pilus assembly protein PilM